MTTSLRGAFAATKQSPAWRGDIVPFGDCFATCARNDMVAQSAHRQSAEKIEPLVYQLYGLSPDENATVEGKDKGNESGSQKNQYELIFVERLTNMITLPFLVIVFLLIVAFIIGVAFGASLKDPASNSEKWETPPAKRRIYTITFTENQLNDPNQLNEDSVFLDISDWKPPRNKEIKLVKPDDSFIKGLENKKPLDKIDRKNKDLR